MWMYVTKTLLSALIIVIVTELAKRSGFVGGLVKSLPLVSLISFVWLYMETKDVAKVASLSVSTFWFVIPTLPTFLIFPALLQHLGFWASLGLSILSLMVTYGATMFVLNRIGISL